MGYINPDENVLPSKGSTDPGSSAFKAATWKKLQPAWKITTDLWGSALDIRNLGSQYLTRFRKEPEEKFAARLERSVYSNAFRETIETQAGMVFRSDPRPANIHPEIDAMLTDIDLCGNSFWAFNLENFTRFLRDGNGFVWVDAPELSPPVRKKVESGARPTLADRQGDRPFLVFYEAQQLINYRIERVGAAFRFTQATIEECVMVPDGEFGEREVTRHRILRPRSVTVLEKDPKTEKFNLADSYVTPFDEIFLFPASSLDSVPPYLTLGMLNTLNYNQKSDYDDICHLVCTPLRIDKYDDKASAMEAKSMETASPGVGRKIWGQHADVKYAEVGGSGMQLSRERYQDVEKEMARFGIGMLSPSDLDQIRTATEVMDSAGQRQSKLSKRAREWENMMEKALYAMARWVNEIKGRNTIDLENAEEKTKLKLKIDYDRLTFSLDQLNFFNTLVDSGKLSLQTFLEWLPQVADMPQGFDPTEELRRIASVNAIEFDDPNNPESGL